MSFSCLYSESNVADGTPGGDLMGRKMEITALFALKTSGLALQRLGALYF